MMLSRRRHRRTPPQRRKENKWNQSFYCAFTLLSFSLATTLYWTGQNQLSSTYSAGSVVTALESKLQDFVHGVGSAAQDLHKLAEGGWDSLTENEQHPKDESNGAPLAGLSCDVYGGPPDELAQEMVYWEDIPSDRYDLELFIVLLFCLLFVHLFCPVLPQQ